MLRRRSAPRGPGRARGLGLVELLIGLVLGLFVAGGALMLLASQIDDNRRMLLETRVVQDLRAAADVIARDLRRAGYWAAASTGMWVTGMTAAPPTNPYTRLSGSACGTPGDLTQKTTAGTSSALCFAIAQDADAAVGNGELFGYQLDGGVVYAVVAGAARVPLTDPKAVTVTVLDITPTSQVLPVTEFCSKGCTAPNCPEVVIREYEVILKGHVPGDTASTRSLRTDVRMRNDFVGGFCNP